MFRERSPTAQPPHCVAFLDGFCQPSYLFALLCVGRRDVQGQEVAERVHGDMGFAAVFLFVAVVARAATALGRALHGAPIKDGGARLWVAPLNAHSSSLISFG